MKKIALAASVLLVIGFFAFIAVAGQGDENSSKAATHELPAQALANRSEQAATQQNGGSAEDNHGQCVSMAARMDVDGLQSWQHGVFVSSVAQDESLVGADCDVSSQLAAALSAESQGKSGASGNDDGNGESTSSSARTDGQAFGASKKSEHAKNP